MNRRDFLKKAGMGTAALGLAACAPKAGGSIIEETEGNDLSKGTMAQHYSGVGLLGYGCMRWKMVKDKNGKDVVDQEDVNRLVDYALEHGVTYFDSAPVYLQGQSEEATAKALLRHPRDSYQIATKCSNMGRGPQGMESGKKMYHQSLEYYQTDHIDYYLLHGLSDYQGFKDRFEDNGLMDYLMQEREKGHIRNLGFSFHGTADGFDQLMALHDKYHWDFVQIQMNYVDWAHASGRNGNAEHLYNELDKREIPVVIMEPLLGGRLANMPAALADELKTREPGRSLASWAFRFCGTFPRILTVLSGMTYMEHLQDNLKSFLDFDPLTGEEIKFLDSIGQRFTDYPLINCTGCQYCMPCPFGINIPGIFKFYNDNVNGGTYVSSKDQKDYRKARNKYLLAYDKAIPTVRQADHCISCNQCAPRCPQHIRIPQELDRIQYYIEKLKQDTL